MSGDIISVIPNFFRYEFEVFLALDIEIYWVFVCDVVNSGRYTNVCRNLMPPFLWHTSDRMATSKMEATVSFEASLTLYQTSRRHIAEDANIRLTVYIQKRKVFTVLY
jgi:hypothetical protein